MGGLQTAAVSLTGATTLTVDNKNVMANASGSAFTLTLPSCYTAMADGLTPIGTELTIIKTDASANAVTLATVSSETINYLGSASATYVIGSAGGVTMVCGSDNNWYVTVSIVNLVTPGNGIFTWTNGVPSLAMANLPHFTWYGTFAGTFGTSTNNSLGAIWSPTSAVTMTRLDIAIGTAPSGCTTYPVIGVYDSTTATWLNSASVAITAGHNLSMGVQTAAAGCTTNAGTAQLTMEYVMQ
jgi:hypothetical protein